MATNEDATEVAAAELLLRRPSTEGSRLATKDSRLTTKERIAPGGVLPSPAAVTDKRTRSARQRQLEESSEGKGAVPGLDLLPGGEAAEPATERVEEAAEAVQEAAEAVQEATEAATEATEATKENPEAEEGMSAVAPMWDVESEIRALGAEDFDLPTPPGENEFWAKDVLAMLAGSASMLGWKVMPKHKPTTKSVATVFGLPESPEQFATRLKEFDQDYYDSLQSIHAPSQAESKLSTSRSVDGPLFMPKVEGVPALGLHYSPCSSASSRVASAALKQREAVPGLDLDKVHMGYDDDDEDDDDEDNPQQTLVAAMGGGHDVPLLNMSSLQHGYSSAETSSGARLRGGEQLIPPSRDLLRSPASSSQGNDHGAVGWGQLRPPSRGMTTAIPAPPGGSPYEFWLGGAPVLRASYAGEDGPTAWEEQNSMMHRSGTAPGAIGIQARLMSSTGSLSLTGATSIAGKPLLDSVDAKVKLPPLKQKQKPKGKSRGPSVAVDGKPGAVDERPSRGNGKPVVAHVHAHHHHHYHVYPQPKAATGEPLAGAVCVGGAGN